MNEETFRKRRQVLQTYLKREQLLGMVTSREALMYLTGLRMEGHERLIALLMSGHHALWVVPRLEEETVSLTGLSVVTYTDDEAIQDVLTRALLRLVGESGDASADHLAKSLPFTGVAVEKKQIPLFFAESLDASLSRLFSSLSRVNWIDLDETLARQRMVKDANEQAYLKEAARRLSNVLDTVMAEDLKPGMREIDLVHAIEARARKMGVREMSFPTIVLSGARASLPHGESSEAPIEAGFLLIDLGFAVSGYHADMTRTYILGEPDARALDMLKAVLEAQEKAIRCIRPGVSYSELDQVARESLRAYGYDAYFTHRLGHGLGLSVHERPSIHALETLPIASGHAFTVEPGIYLPGVGGVRIEDDVLIEDDGSVRILTTSSKRLEDLIRSWP